MIKSDSIYQNKLNNLFYLHPFKCGGHSIHQCLKDMDVRFFYTRSLQLNQCTLDFLRNSHDRKIVFGHINYLPHAETDEQIKIKSEIAKTLYLAFDLIMPTRNPSNLLQSWMHYSKTKSNKILQSLGTNQKKITKKGGAMLWKMSALKQNCLVFSENGKSLIRKGDDFPCFKLKEEDEEWNLLAFADFLRANGKSTLAQLCSMQSQLFALDWVLLQNIILGGKSVNLDLPVSCDKRSVIYYDCENIDQKHQVLLDQAVCSGFTERLLNTCKNASEGKSRNKGSNFDSVNKKLQRIVPGEWQIYEMSKADE